jgi:hypothetical protein
VNELLRVSDIINLINEPTGRNVKLQIVSPADYVSLGIANDVRKETGFILREEDLLV